VTARTMWKAVLVVGGKRVPVDFFSAVADRDVRLHLLHASDRARVRQHYVDPRTGRTVATDDLRRGFEVERGRFVVLHESELAALEPAPSRDIELVAFVPGQALDHRWYERPYYLGPERGHADDYFALAAAIEKTGREGFARWTMRKREYAGALRAHDGYLVLIALRHADEVLAATALQPPEGRDFDARELDLAKQLVGALSGPFEHAAFHDEYRERLHELIATKRKGKKVDVVRWRAKPVTDEALVKTLERSLEKAG
jgi:DNA end-binding protein Ku